MTTNQLFTLAMYVNLSMPVQYGTLHVLCGAELAGNWRDAKLLQCMEEQNANCLILVAPRQVTYLDSCISLRARGKTGCAIWCNHNTHTV